MNDVDDLFSKIATFVSLPKDYENVQFNNNNNSNTLLNDYVFVERLERESKIDSYNTYSETTENFGQNKGAYLSSASHTAPDNINSLIVYDNVKDTDENSFDSETENNLRIDICNLKSIDSTCNLYNNAHSPHNSSNLINHIYNKSNECFAKTDIDNLKLNITPEFINKYILPELLSFLPDSPINIADASKDLYDSTFHALKKKLRLIWNRKVSECLLLFNKDTSIGNKKPDFLAPVLINKNINNTSTNKCVFDQPDFNELLTNSLVLGEREGLVIKVDENYFLVPKKDHDVLKNKQISNVPNSTTKAKLTMSRLPRYVPSCSRLNFDESNLPKLVVRLEPLHKEMNKCKNNYKNFIDIDNANEVLSNPINFQSSTNIDIKTKRRRRKGCTPPTKFVKSSIVVTNHPNVELQLPPKDQMIYFPQTDNNQNDIPLAHSSNFLKHNTNDILSDQGVGKNILSPLGPNGFLKYPLIPLHIAKALPLSLAKNPSATSSHKNLQQKSLNDFTCSNLITTKDNITFNTALEVKNLRHSSRSKPKINYNEDALFCTNPQVSHNCDNFRETSVFNYEAYDVENEVGTISSPFQIYSDPSLPPLPPDICGPLSSPASLLPGHHKSFHCERLQQHDKFKDNSTKKLETKYTQPKKGIKKFKRSSHGKYIISMKHRGRRRKNIDNLSNVIVNKKYSKFSQIFNGNASEKLNETCGYDSSNMAKYKRSTPPNHTSSDTFYHENGGEKSTASTFWGRIFHLGLYPEFLKELRDTVETLQEESYRDIVNDRSHSQSVERLSGVVSELGLMEKWKDRISRHQSTLHNQREKVQREMEELEQRLKDQQALAKELQQKTVFCDEILSSKNGI